MKLSVIVACRDAQRRIERTLNSIVEQAFADSEIIVVDDASTDRTVKLAQDLAARIGNLAVVRLETPQGLAAARNAGLARALGDYVAFLDAGDEWEAGVLAKVIGDLDLFPWAHGVEFAVRLIGGGDMQPQQLALVASTRAGNLVLRRDFVHVIGGFPTDGALAARGADVASFRIVLRRWGTVGATAQVHLVHPAKSDEIVEHVAATTRVKDGALEVDPPDETARAAEAASRDHIRRIDAAMLQSIGNPPLHRIPCEIGGRRFEFEAPDRPEFIGQATAALSQGEYPMLPFLGSVQTILDVGAGVGASAVNFSCNYPAARVIALEPRRFNFVLLRRNALAHPRIEAYQLGLFNTTTRLDFVVSEGAQRESALFVEPGLFLQSLRAESIDIMRLDNAGLETTAFVAMGDRVRDTRAIILRYHRDTDRRIADAILAPTHMLYWGRSLRPNHGEMLYVQRALLGPDGR